MTKKKDKHHLFHFYFAQLHKHHTEKKSYISGNYLDGTKKVES